MLHQFRREPSQFGVNKARWTLADFREHCEGLGLQTDAGLCQVFERLGIHYKRRRDYVHSPDPQYEAKRAVVERLKREVQTSQGLAALLFLDEITYYRQPSLALSLIHI